MGYRITRRAGSSLRVARGFTLVELMVAMVISLLVLIALVSIYVNVARSNEELSKTNNLIENGRFALQVIEGDLVHAGFWGGYLPQFDNLTHAIEPGDVPTTVPDPCVPYASWDGTVRSNLIGIPVQTSDALWSGAGCLSPAVMRTGTDALVVRHLETCIPGETNCDALDTNRLYFQTSTCSAEQTGNAVSFAGATTITFAEASAADGAYVGAMIRTTSGTGVGQVRMITAYDGGSLTATVSPAWDVVPDGTTQVAMDYLLGTTTASLHRLDCIGTGTPAHLPVTAGSNADRRRFISNIYYIADRQHPNDATQVVPTLMRSTFDFGSGALAQRAPVPLIDGIEGMRIEVGIDDVSETGAAVDFTAPIDWADPTTMRVATNRGDGSPDRYVRCTTAAPCSAEDLANVVSVKLWVLARSREPSRDYIDDKSYCLATAAVGTCPTDATIAAQNDNYKRHVFSRTVRLINVSARRETPFP